MSLANTSALKKSSSSGSTDSPYLGSKISLVSKAKIRYEGVLYTIDANESTVALSKVRSFGTEDRPTDRPVPARDEIFEYIIFRGADIEDLQVREPPQSSLTQDPAIVESSAYADHARSNTIGTNTNLSGLSHNGQSRSHSNRGTMPSPPHYQGTGKGFKSSDPTRQLNFNQHRPARSFNQQSPMHQYEHQDYAYGNQRRVARQQHQQDYYDDYNFNRRATQNYGYGEYPRPTQRYARQSQANQADRFYPARRQPTNGAFLGTRQRRNSTGGMNSSNNNNNNQQQTRNQRPQQSGERNNAARNHANNSSNNNNSSSNRSTLKFVGDFDFEKSNAEFDKNAIEDEIKKSLSLKPHKSETSTDSSNSAEHDKDKENQHTYSSSTQSEHHEQQVCPLDGYYDKQKSFFDRISCESSEKEKTTARRNWNDERRMNAETFGLKYRPLQQAGNQRPPPRRNSGRYQPRSNNGNYATRNSMYYGNFNNRLRAY